MACLLGAGLAERLKRDVGWGVRTQTDKAVWRLQHSIIPHRPIDQDCHDGNRDYRVIYHPIEPRFKHVAQTQIIKPFEVIHASSSLI